MFKMNFQNDVGWLFVLFNLIYALGTSEAFSVVPSNLSVRSPLVVEAPSFLEVVREKSGITASTKNEDLFFIRKCLPADVGQASDILTDAFFKENTNCFTYQWERLTTYLSLESTYPKTPWERHTLFVACHSKSGMVLGLAEIDDRPSKVENATPRPYMYNVAVHPKFRRKGIAKALVLACEEMAMEWDKPEVYLKVRDLAEPAVNMYKSLGYQILSTKLERLNKKTLNLHVMSKLVLSQDEMDDDFY